MLGFNSCVIALSPDATDPVVIVISLYVVFPALSATSTFIVYSVSAFKFLNVSVLPDTLTLLASLYSSPFSFI